MPAHLHCLVKLVNSENKGRAIQDSKSSLSSQACPPRQSNKQRKCHTSQQVLTVQSKLSTKTVQQTKKVPYKPASPHCPVKLVHQDSPTNKGSIIKKPSKSSLSSQAYQLSSPANKERSIQASKSSLSSQACQLSSPTNKERAIQASKSSLSSQACQLSRKQRKGHTSQ